MPAGPADAVASLRTFPITITLGDTELTLEPRGALAWLEALADEPPNLELIIPGMVQAEDQPVLDDLLLAGKVKLSDLGDAILDSVAVAAGRPWWTALALIRLLCSDARPVLIRATAMADLERLPLGAWCDLVYVELVRNMSQEDRTQFDMTLITPPPGVEINPEELIDELGNSQAFFGMMQQPGR